MITYNFISVMGAAGYLSGNLRPLVPPTQRVGPGRPGSKRFSRLKLLEGRSGEERLHPEV
jgi:hypothetical protein